MKDSKGNDDQKNQVDKSNKQDYPAGRSNEGGNFPEQRSGEKHFSQEASTSHSSKKDPQGTSMGLGSQPAAVNLDNGASTPTGRQDKPGQDANPGQDDTGKGEGETNTPGYGASNNAAGV